jgi:hypothetical protein
MYDIIPVSQIIIWLACCFLQRLLRWCQGEEEGDKERVSRGRIKGPIGGERASMRRRFLFEEKCL